LTLKLLLIF